MEKTNIMEKTIEMAWRELEQFAQAGDTSERAMDRALKLVKIIKNGREAERLETFDEYSGWNGGRRLEGYGAYHMRGRYTAGDGYDGEYSYGGGRGDMATCVREMMERERDPAKREEARRFLERIESR